MGRLSPHTVNCYKTKLRKLRKLLPLMPENHAERGKVVAHIEKLTNQLGLEMTDLEIQLARGPGRPRIRPVVEELEVKTEVNVAPVPVESLATAHERRQAERKKLFEAVPEVVSAERERESEEELRKLLEVANDKLGGQDVTSSREQDPDDAHAVK